MSTTNLLHTSLQRLQGGSSTYDESPGWSPGWESASEVDPQWVPPDRSTLDPEVMCNIDLDHLSSPVVSSLPIYQIEPFNQREERNPKELYNEAVSRREATQQTSLGSDSERTNSRLRLERIQYHAEHLIDVDGLSVPHNIYTRYLPCLWNTGASEGHTTPLASPTTENLNQIDLEIHSMIVSGGLQKMAEYILNGSLSFSVAQIHSFALNKAENFPTFQHAFAAAAMSHRNAASSEAQTCMSGMSATDLQSFSNATAPRHPIAKAYYQSTFEEIQSTYDRIIVRSRKYAEYVFMNKELYVATLGFEARCRPAFFAQQLDMAITACEYLHSRTVHPGLWLSPILRDMTAVMLSFLYPHQTFKKVMEKYGYVLPFTVFTIPSIMLESELIFLHDDGCRMFPTAALKGWTAHEDLPRDGQPSRIVARALELKALQSQVNSKGHRDVKDALATLVYEILGHPPTPSPAN